MCFGIAGKFLKKCLFVGKALNENRLGAKILIFLPWGRIYGVGCAIIYHFCPFKYYLVFVGNQGCALVSFKHFAQIADLAYSMA
jgi:hypothetical protein